MSVGGVKAFLRPRVASTCLAALCAVCPVAALAQDVSPDNKWYPWIEFGGYAGTDGLSRGELGLFLPLSQDANSLFFSEVRGRLFERDVQEGNIALGYRTMLENGWNAGGWVGFDARHTELGSTFPQISGGVELLHPDGGFRLNGYLPLDSTRRILSASRRRRQQRRPAAAAERHHRWH